MKNKFTIIVFFLFYLSTLYSQNTLVVNYQTQFIGRVFNNDESQDKAKTALLNSTNGTEDEINTLTFQLFVKGKKSLFKAVEKMEKDNETLGQKMGRIVAGYENIYYRDDSLKRTISDKIIGSTRYKINEIHNSNNWNLTNESKTIQNYLCYLAKTKYSHLDVFAWYCPALPYSAGPTEFAGLPGLILELQKGKIIYQAVKIDLNSNEELNFDINSFQAIDKNGADEKSKKVKEFLMNKKI
jgi:GLPGLI family protein